MTISRMVLYTNRQNHAWTTALVPTRRRSWMYDLCSQTHINWTSLHKFTRSLYISNNTHMVCSWLMNI